ncbi:hypothetical protein D3C72_2233550 [compost metagenome]
MCGACATPIVSVKLNLGGQCRGYSIREDGPGGSGHPMCGACATPTLSVKLDRCGGYRIREDGYRAPESPDVWRTRHSYRIREVEPGRSVPWLPYP